MTPPSRRLKWLGPAVRFTVVLIAVAWLYKHTEWAELRQVLRSADWRLAALGCAAFAPITPLIALRLKWLLAVHEVHLPLWDAIKITFVGNFLIQALPVGTSGGDAVKAWYVARNTPHKHEAVTSVFFDRVVGVVGLVLLSGVMVLFNLKNPALAKSARYIAAVVLALIVFGGAYYSHRIRAALRLEQLIARLPLARHLNRIDQAVFAFRRRPRRVAACLLLTMLLQGSAIVSIFLGGWALGLIGDGSRPLAAFPIYLAYIPICFLSGALPLGAMELLYAELLSKSAGLGSWEAAISLSLLSRLIQLLWALPGGLAVLTGQVAIHPHETPLEPSDPAPADMSRV